MGAEEFCGNKKNIEINWRSLAQKAIGVVSYHVIHISIKKKKEVLHPSKSRVRNCFFCFFLFFTPLVTSILRVVSWLRSLCSTFESQIFYSIPGL